MLGIFLKEANLQVHAAPYDSQGGVVDANVQVNVASRKVSPEELHVCTLTVTVTALTQADKRLVYVAAVTFEALCRLASMADTVREAALNGTVPSQLVPYCREALVSLIGKSGHAPFMLPHMLFENKPIDPATEPRPVVH